jgi:hypothetical protein
MEPRLLGKEIPQPRLTLAPACLFRYDEAPPVGAIFGTHSKALIVDSYRMAKDCLAFGLGPPRLGRFPGLRLGSGLGWAGGLTTFAAYAGEVCFDGVHDWESS